MAQSLDSRINSALRSAARLKDVETVIADVEAEIATTKVKMEKETARSIDPALTTPQAREARNNAADLEHDIRRLNASLGMLKEKREKIVADHAEEQRRKRYDAAKAERDDLARHIRTRYPEIAMEFVALVQRIEASDQQCQRVNAELRAGEEPLKIAEHLARNCGHYWGNSVVERLGTARLPLLSRYGHYVPIQHRTADGLQAQWAKGIEADQAFAKQPVEGIALEVPNAQPAEAA